MSALPHSEESERAVLAGILLNQGYLPLVAAKLEVEDFYLEKHQAIYAAMLALAATSRSIDLRTIQAQLELKSQFQLVGGLPYLTGLDLFLPDLDRTMDYVGVVKERSVRRRLIEITTQVTKSCFDGAEAPQLLSEAMASLTQLVGQADRKEPRQIYLPAIEMAHELRQRAGNASPFQGFFTGLPTLDGQIVGLERKTLSLWIAKPGHGKTAWTLQVAEAVNQAGGRVFYGSFEMSERTLVRRLASRALRIPIGVIARGELTEWQIGEIERICHNLNKRDFIVDDASLSTAEFCSKARARAAMGYPIDLLVYDYLQLGAAPKTGGEEGWQENGAKCKMLRELAAELDAHVLVVGQANKEGSVHGGGGWAESDLLVYIERPWLLSRDQMAPPEDRAAVTMGVQKCRLGPPGDVGLAFDGASQTFTEAAGSFWAGGGENLTMNF